jgi:hypothetical protein
VQRGAGTIGARSTRWAALPGAIASVAATAWIAAAHAGGGDTPLVIEWAAPGECPAREKVEARVEELLGGPPKPGTEPLTVKGTIERSGDKFALSLELERGGHASTRKLESSSCQSVSEAGSLVVALAFDPDAVRARQAAPPASSTPVAPPSTPPSVSPAPSVSAPPTVAPTSAPPMGNLPPPAFVAWTPPPSPPQRTAVQLGFGVSLGVIGDYGSLPGFSPGFRALIALALDAYRVEPLFEAWPEAGANSASKASVGATFSLVAGGLRVCRRIFPWSWSRRSIFWLTGCVDGEIGSLSASGFGVDKPAAASALWGALGAEAEARVALPGPIGLFAGPGFVVPFDPRPFVVESPTRDEIFTSAPASLRLTAGIDARF